MRRSVCRSGRLALLDGGSSRRTSVLRLCPRRSSAHISLIRRRSRPIVTPAPTSSGSRPHHRETFTRVNVDREIDDAQTNPLTAGPSISADVNYWRLVRSNTSPAAPLMVREGRRRVLYFLGKS